MKTFRFLLFVFLALCGGTVFGDDLICSYTARLSPRDHRASDGVLLRDVASVIRQDRANFHRFRLRDPEDEHDDFFSSMRNRTELEKLVQRGRVSAAAAREIVSGNPLVSVEVFRSNAGYQYVVVRVL